MYGGILYFTFRGTYFEKMRLCYPTPPDLTDYKGFRMTTYQQVTSTLKKLAHKTSIVQAKYFKTGKGDYAEHDKFIGVNVPTLRKLAQEWGELPLSETRFLLASKVNEERFIALAILVQQYKVGKSDQKEKIYQFYLDNLKGVNNWNLVDASAHLIIGAHLLNKNKAILLTLSKSPSLWERRIAIVATWYFIRNNEFSHTLKIAKVLLNDSHDLIHKAIGWMLREVGKKDINVLVEFLDQNALKMPRTALRYAIESFPETKRKKYLKMKTV